MIKFADISAFESLQTQANTSFVSDVSVFNGAVTKKVLKRVKDIFAVLHLDNEQKCQRIGYELFKELSGMYGSGEAFPLKEIQDCAVTESRDIADACIRAGLFNNWERADKRFNVHEIHYHNMGSILICQTLLDYAKQAARSAQSKNSNEVKNA